MSIPRHVTRLATAAFLAGIRAADLLALMPPEVDAAAALSETVPADGVTGLLG